MPSVTYKDIETYSQKVTVAGTEKIPVSATEYITPVQIAALTDVPANYPLANSVTAWNTEVRAGSASPDVTLPAPDGTGVAEELRYIFTASSTDASFTAPSGYVLGDDDGYSGLSAGNTLAYTDLTSGSIYECSFVVLDATHISLVMKEHTTA